MRLKITAVLLLGLAFASFKGAEEDFIEQLKKKFAGYQQKYPRVKVHLYFNQDVYSSGDTAFFQARFMTENLKPVAGKQILSLDVVNAEGQVAQHQNYSIKDGIGPGQIVISPNVPPGLYTFTAYNEWMRNFGTASFFQKTIAIVGRKKIITNPSPVTARFYPEGGHLVQGVTNKVVVQAPGQSTLQIVDPDGKEITTCKVHDHGLGFFMFNPEPGKVYRALAGGSSWEIPAPEEGLAVLTTASEKGESVRILLEASKNSALRNETLHLVVATQNTIPFTASLKFDEKPFLQVLVPQADLPQGIARVYLLNGDGDVLAERLFYVSKPTQPRVNIGSDKATYQPREKVSLNISLTDESGNAVTGDFAISVTNKKLFPETRSQTIAEALLLASDLGYSAEVFLDSSNDGWFSSLDLYLITKRWTSLNWREVLSGTSEPKKFGFRNTLNIAGAALDKSTGKPVPDSTLIMVYLQNHMMGYEAYTTQNGAFDLPFLFDFWGDDQVFYLMEYKKKIVPNAVITLSQDPVTFSRSTSWKEGDEVDPYGDFKFKKTIVDHSFSFYSKNAKPAKKELVNTNADFEDEVTGADVSVNVEDYIVFPTMEDVIREVIPSLQYRKIGGKPAVRVLLSEVNTNPNQGDPLYVIDGVMTKNTEYFLSLKPVDIVTVKIVKDVNKLSRFGALGKSGMVLIQTKKTDGRLKELSTILPVEGLSKPLHFSLPDYSQKSNPRNPDFRSTLYWNPMVKTHADGTASLTFFLSDDTGPVSVKLEGMTSDGKPFTKETEIEVAFNPLRN